MRKDWSGLLWLLGAVGLGLPALGGVAHGFRGVEEHREPGGAGDPSHQRVWAAAESIGISPLSGIYRTPLGIRRKMLARVRPERGADPQTVSAWSLHFTDPRGEPLGSVEVGLAAPVKLVSTGRIVGARLSLSSEGRLIARVDEPGRISGAKASGRLDGLSLPRYWLDPEISVVSDPLVGTDLGSRRFNERTVEKQFFQGLINAWRTIIQVGRHQVLTLASDSPTRDKQIVDALDLALDESSFRDAPVFIHPSGW